MDEFKNKSPKEIQELLEDNCQRKEEGHYFRPLSQDEIEAEREQFTKLSIEHAVIEGEFDEIKSQFKQRLKPISQAKDVSLERLRSKGETVKGVLYYMPNHDQQMMNIYNEEGELIESRRLRPDERTRNLQFSVASNL